MQRIEDIDLESELYKKKKIVHMDLPAANPVQIGDTESAIKKMSSYAVLNKQIRAIYVFHYLPDKVEWTLMEENVSEKETKGILYATMREMKQTMNARFSIKPTGTSFIRKKHALIDHVFQFPKEAKFFSICVSHDDIVTFGSAYEESTLCHAFLRNKPLQLVNVIRNMTNGVSHYRKIGLS